MIVSVMAISILVLTRQIYSEETNGPHAHCREPVPLIANSRELSKRFCSTLHLLFKIPNALSTVTLAEGCPILSTRIQSYPLAFHRKTGSLVV